MKQSMRQHIRKLREEKGLTQADMAEHLSVSRLTYLSIENGDKEPSLEQVKMIASALGISMQDLLFPDMQSESLLTHLTDLSKFRQMCLACIKFGGDERDGKITKTKLAKLLYLVDFSWYRKSGESMSKLTYYAFPRGPVAYEFFQITDEMFESGQVQIESKGNALLFSVTESPTYTGLSKDEASHIETVCARWKEHDTQTIVEFTHKQQPWRLTLPGAKIAYELAEQIPTDSIY